MKKLIGFLILIITFFSCDKGGRSATGGHDVVDNFASIGMYSSFFIALVCAIMWYINKNSDTDSAVSKTSAAKILFWLFFGIGAVCLILIVTGNS